MGRRGARHDPPAGTWPQSVRGPARDPPLKLAHSAPLPLSPSGPRVKYKLRPAQSPETGGPGPVLGPGDGAPVPGVQRPRPVSCCMPRGPTEQLLTTTVSHWLLRPPTTKRPCLTCPGRDTLPNRIAPQHEPSPPSLGRATTEGRAPLGGEGGVAPGASIKLGLGHSRLPASEPRKCTPAPRSTGTCLRVRPQCWAPPSARRTPACRPATAGRQGQADGLRPASAPPGSQSRRS